MNKTLHAPRLSGTVRIPSSKSEAHRCLIVAALSTLYGAGIEPHRILCTDSNEDIDATMRCLSALGADIEKSGAYITVKPITIIPATATLDCGESGSTLRFLLPVVCALGTLRNGDMAVSLEGHGRLPERPLSPLYEELVAHGATLSCAELTPLVVSGGIRGGAYQISGSVSSQFISGLLFALPLLTENSTLTVTGRAESVPYIDMTLDAISSVTSAVRGALPTWHITGQNAKKATLALPTLTVSGDWSGAAFFLAAGVMSVQGTSITVTGLSANTRQGDSAIVDVLRRMGGNITVSGNDFTAHGSNLHGCEIDATQIPDLVPILAVAASVAEGETRIVGASRLRLKESDRLATVSAMISALGGDIRETEDGLIIRGVPTLRGGTVDTVGDHRIAMSAAIAATRCTDTVTVTGAEAVAKSYPAFWDDFRALCL